MGENTSLSQKQATNSSFETRFAFALEVAKLITPKPTSISAFLVLVEEAYEKLGETMQKCKESTRNVEKMS